MTSTPRVGIIGAGGMIGAVHARAVRAAGADISSVLGSTPASTASAAQRLGAAAASNLTQLIEDVDIVHICTPNSLHANQAAAAISAGKHVICEKPLATTVPAATQLTLAAERAGVVAAVPFVYRFYSMVREARARVLAGVTGSVRLAHGSYLQDWLANPDIDNWRTEVSRGSRSRAFGDIGVHWFDLMEFVTGQRVVTVAANALQVHSHRGGNATVTEDAMTVMFETDGGVQGTVVLSQVSLGRKNRLLLSIDADNQALEFNQECPDELWIGGSDQNISLLRGSGRQSADAAAYSMLPPGHPEGYQEAFNSFVRDVYRAVAGEVIDDLPQFTDGLRGALITETVLDAAARQERLKMPA